MGIAESWSLFYFRSDKMIKTAILVDGGFYRKRAAFLFGKTTAEERADELQLYCKHHINSSNEKEDKQSLYRILYYDCLPIKKDLYHPLKHENISYGKSDTYIWMTEFIEQLKRMRKFALRLGELSDTYAGIGLNPTATKKLCLGKISIDDLKDEDLSFSLGQQKGVDMKIGLDIASLSYKKLVDRIILISGDSDFVPAAKLARREGIDFILDPMGANIKPDLFEHIDGLKSQWKKHVKNKTAPV